MTLDQAALDTAHRHSSRHRDEVVRSDVCGCFYCRETFPPVEIERWLPEGTGTAFCPRCDVDAVIGSASGFPVTDAAFLRAMHERWFSDA